MQFKIKFQENRWCSATGRLEYVVWHTERDTAMVTTSAKLFHVFPRKNKQTGGTNSSYHKWTRASFLTVTFHHRFFSANKKLCSHGWIWLVQYLQKHFSWFISTTYLRVVLYSHKKLSRNVWVISHPKITRRKFNIMKPAFWTICFLYTLWCFSFIQIYLHNLC